MGPYSVKVLVLKCGAQLEAVEMAMRSALHRAGAAALSKLLRMTRTAWVTLRLLSTPSPQTGPRASGNSICRRCILRGFLDAELLDFRHADVI